MIGKLTACLAAFALVLAGARAQTPGPQVNADQTAAQPAEAGVQAQFQQDRQAILAMAGDFDVDFDFHETVALAQGYKLQKPQRSGGHEVVRVIEDRGDFISLQHILVAGGDEKFPIKHWRQDWRYEPRSVLAFTGGNAWETRAVPEPERKGAWSQTVYQVEDSPRYGAVGRWTHANGISEWTGKAELRPLPRRDATKRNDYDAILAVNRHAITPEGWVHEQDNTKVVLREEKPKALAREVGINTYKRFEGFEVKVATDYWDATKDYWAAVRKRWDALEAAGKPFGLTVQGEPEPLYSPLLELADKVQAKEITTAAAVKEADSVIAKFTTTELGAVQDRLAQAGR